MYHTANEVPLAERESKLWEASRQYMRGEIPLRELEEVERHYALPPEGVTQLKPPLKDKPLKKHTFFLYLKKLWLLLTQRG